jgi:hypothetical protein
MSGLRIAGVRFGRSGPVYFVAAPDGELAVGQRVDVEIGGEIRPGRVVITPAQLLLCEVEEPRGRVVTL